MIMTSYQTLNISGTFCYINLKCIWLFSWISFTFMLVHYEFGKDIPAKISLSLIVFYICFCKVLSQNIPCWVLIWLPVLLVGGWGPGFWHTSTLGWFFYRKSWTLPTWCSSGLDFWIKVCFNSFAFFYSMISYCPVGLIEGLTFWPMLLV